MGFHVFQKDGMHVGHGRPGYRQAVHDQEARQHRSVSVLAMATERSCSKLYRSKRCYPRPRPCSEMSLGEAEDTFILTDCNYLPVSCGWRQYVRGEEHLSTKRSSSAHPESSQVLPFSLRAGRHDTPQRLQVP